MIRSSKHVVAGRASLHDEMAAGDFGGVTRGSMHDAIRWYGRSRSILTGGSPKRVMTVRRKGSYRSAVNRRVSLESVLEPHVQASTERCRAVGEVLRRRHDGILFSGG